MRAPGRARTYPVEGRITRLSWLPDGRSLLVMAVDRRGVSSIDRVQAAGEEVTRIVRGLDASPYASGVPLAVAPDGRRAFVALASPGAPEPAERHRAHADRDLDIYEVDLETGERRPVVATSAEVALTVTGRCATVARPSKHV